MLSIIKSLFSSKVPAVQEPESSVLPWNAFPPGMRTMYFDGEKTPYELGPAIDYKIDYYTLRARAWQAYLESDIIQNAIKKYCLWIVGTGLKLQSQPQENILKNIKLGSFVEDVESRFRLFANENFSTYSGMQSLNSQAADALQNALNAGDLLNINRFENGKPTLEIIDGVHVRTPMDNKILKAAIARGNKIKLGVEVNSRNTHVAYYVREEDGSYKRILARGSRTGRKQAWLSYGMRHKINDTRGVSLLAAILETVSKMDRYKDAALGSAEELAKIVYSVEHNKESTGEDPTLNTVAQTFSKGKGVAPETNSYDSCETNGIATKVSQSTSKQTINMPIGSKLVKGESGSDVNFGEFFGVNIDIVYATIGIPPEVAMDKFGGSFSSSRAGLKSWDYKMFVDRFKLLKNQYYQPFYNFWLDIQILKGTIEAPGYLEALNSKDQMFLAAYRNARFIGMTVPHIDPVKEVNAERLKLGPRFANQPLTTLERSAEELNTGDADQILKKAQNEKENSEFFDTVDADRDDSNGAG